MTATAARTLARLGTCSLLFAGLALSGVAAQSTSPQPVKDPPRPREGRLLSLSALWVGWRHQFTAAGLLLGLLAFLGGASFQCIYLLVVSLQAKGDMSEILLGKARAAA